MNQNFRYILNYALVTLARVLTPALQRRVIRLCLLLSGNVPQLGVAWVVRFANPARSGDARNLSIDATLQQFGNLVRGRGHVQGEPGDPFIYRGVLKRNAFYGTFRRVDSHVLAGTGTFVLKISADTRRMTGYCIWYDNLLDDVWSSTYTWARKG
jgi:hypothetical protein